MSGRHSTRPSTKAESRQSRPVSRVGIGAVAGAVVVASVVGWESAASPGGILACHDDTTLTLAAAPEIAPVIASMVTGGEDEEVETELGCARVQVVPTDPVDAAAAVRSGQGAPDMWIPDTSAWLAQMPGGLATRQRWSFAKTPVVLAGAPGAARPDTWLSALSQPGATLLDPRTSGASVGALVALSAEAVQGATSGKDLSSWLVSAAQAAPPKALSDRDLLSGSAGGGGSAPDWFPTTEQRFVSVQGRESRGDYAPVVPKAGTTLLDYPLVPVARGSDGRLVSSIAETIARRLLAPGGARRLAEAGFRPPSGVPTERSALGEVHEVTVVQPNADAGLFRTWVTLTGDARMLAVLDVSGSMADPAGEETRIGLTQQAVLGALKRLPGSWQLGLWAFSIGLGPGDVDHRELAPVRALASGSGNDGQRAHLADAMRGLGGLVGGGTGLYDTALAAYRDAVSDYSAGQFNSVVLLTDGRNEDSRGLDMPRLLEALRNTQRPQRPVPVITIGMGPQADTAALRRIATATGGTSYVVRDPQALPEIFTDALLERVGWGLR